MWLHCQQVVQYFMLLGRLIKIDQLVRNQISVEEVEVVSIHAHCCTSFYALETIFWDKDWTMCSSVERYEEQVVHDGIKVPQQPFAVARVIDEAIVEILWGSDLRVSKLMPRIDVHKRARTGDMVLDKQVVLNQMKHLYIIHFMSLVVHIHLSSMQKSKL